MAVTTTLVYQHSLVDDVARRLCQKSMSKDKRSPNQPAPFKGEFSFVNKDAGNIDSKDHNAAVSWHVMNRYERWKKQDQAKKLRASANVPVGPLSAPSQLVSQSSTLSDQLQPSRPQRQVPRRASTATRKRQARLASAVQPAAPSSATPFGFDPWRVEQPLQLGYPGINVASTTGSSSGVQTSTTSTPSTHSSMMEDDPMGMIASFQSTQPDPASLYDTSALSITPLLNSLITFAYDVFIPQSWPMENEEVQGSFEVARNWDDAMLINEDTCYANAYLSVLTAAMGISTEDEGLTQQSRYFQGQAMTELRQRVSQSTIQDLITLKAILKLFSSETLVDNTSVARMHLKMLRNLVNGAGGVIMTDAWFREDLLSCDCYFALKYDTRPLFPASEWTPGPLSQPWKARMLSAGIFGDHATSIDPLVEHPTIKAVVSDLRELFKARDYTDVHEVPTEDQLLRWQQLRKFDCISRLADHFVSLTIYPHLYTRPLTQAYTCAATALMAAMVLGTPEPVRFGMKLLANLRRSVQESESEDDMAELGRLRLWALYVGSLAEKVHPAAAADTGWFESEYRNQTTSMGIGECEEIKKLLKQFLLSERLHQEIELGRAHRVVDDRAGLYTACGCSWREPLLDESLVLPEPEEDIGGSRSGSVSISAGKRRADEG